eukprot:gene20522-biopygen6777
MLWTLEAESPTQAFLALNRRWVGFFVNALLKPKTAFGFSSILVSSDNKVPYCTHLTRNNIGLCGNFVDSKMLATRIEPKKTIQAAFGHSSILVATSLPCYLSVVNPLEELKL